MDRVLQLNDFFVEGGKQATSYVLIHITEPSTPEEIAKGYFFVIAELDNAESKHIAKLHELIDQAENDYYETPDEPDKTSLEVVLKKMNQEALGLANAEIALDCIVGAVRQPEIIFTYYGRPQMVLFYKNREGVYQKMDLLQADDGDGKPTQLFSQIIQGKISPNDFLFAGTPHITEFFSHDRLQKIITTRPAVQSAQHIEKVLAQIRNGYSFGGLIMHIDRADAGPVPIRKAAPVVKGTAKKSLNSLFDRERTTASTLSASFLPRINARMQSMFGSKEEEMTNESAKAAPAQVNASHVTHRQASTAKLSFNKKLALGLDFALDVAKVIGRGIWGIFYIIYSIFYTIIRNIVLAAFALTNYQKRRQTILEGWRRQWHSYRENVRNLPTITKILSLVSVAAVAAFIGGISYLQYHKQQTAKQKTFDNAVALIETKIDAMESALIYKDDNAAMAELASAQEVLHGLDCVSKEQKNTCADLQKKINDVTVQVRKVSNTAPTILYDWNTVGAQPTNLVKVGSKLIGFSDATSSLFIYDLLTKETKTVPTSPIVSGFQKASVPKENDYVALLYSNKNIGLFNPADNSFTAAEISYAQTTVNITDISVYNRRLYTLDEKNNQIHKHDSIKGGFGPGKDWIKDGTSIKDATELTIDGDMFILQHGKIVKFTAGVSQPFEVLGLDPGIGGDGSIWTYNDINYLYILDPANKRLVVLNKEGSLKTQLTSTDLVKPMGLAVDSTSNLAYTFDGGKLLQIQLPQ